MIRRPSKILASFIKSIPGKKYFGVYRTLPIFALFGATIEFLMINWTPGNTNFSFFAMVAGSQAVHMYYKPLADMDVLIEQEKKRIREERKKKEEETM